MLGKLKTEIHHLSTAWWCRGHGTAVLLLLATVLWFRSVRDVMFWIAIGFFVVYTTTAVRRYLIERRVRAKATVTAHHAPVAINCACGKLIFDPRPVNSLITLDLPPKVVS